MYGKANPVDALDVFGTYVKGVHAKDALYPTTGRKLGNEVALGQGKVNFPRLVARLKELGYDGALTIEREISGPEQEGDIRSAIKQLNALIAS
jgi:sugar phosphate isomerase/epimerase